MILLTEEAWQASLEAGVAEPRAMVPAGSGTVYWDCEQRGEGPWRWEVWDIMGRQVRQGKWGVSGAPVEIPLNELPHGLYAVRVNGQLVGKVLVE